MTPCPDCQWPLESHDRDISFHLPDELEDWSAEELAEKTSRLDTFLHVKPNRFFMRALIPIHLHHDHIVVFGAWLAVDRPTVENASRIWNTPEYGSFSCSGFLANALPPWPNIVGAPLTVESRHLEELPYAVSSSDAKMNEIVNSKWSHQTVLNSLAEIT